MARGERGEERREVFTDLRASLGVFCLWRSARRDSTPCNSTCAACSSGPQSAFACADSSPFSPAPFSLLYWGGHTGKKDDEGSRRTHNTM